MMVRLGIPPGTPAVLQSMLRPRAMGLWAMQWLVKIINDNKIEVRVIVFMGMVLLGYYYFTIAIF